MSKVETGHIDEVASPKNVRFRTGYSKMVSLLVGSVH